MSRSAALLSSVICHRRILSIILLLSIFLFLLTISPVLAQGPNLVVNPGFESGILQPWLKWGYPRSTVMTLNCCGYSGSWSAWIVPDGRYVELQQNISVTPRRTYDLTAWVKTNALNGQVAWWSNITNSTVCSSTTSGSYVQLFCELNVPDNTSAFNIHLGANSPQGSGQWAITDDWSLTLKTPQSAAYQAFSVLAYNQAQGSKADIWTAQQPASTLGYIASPIGVCTDFPCTSLSGYVETGYYKGQFSTADRGGLGANVLEQYFTWKNVSDYMNSGAFGTIPLSDNTWYNMGVEYNSTLNTWEASFNGSTVKQFPTLDFTSGVFVGCGAESTSQTTNSLGLECENMQYKPIGQGFTLYDYNNVQINNNYCVYKPLQHGAFAWGPCY